MSSLKSTPRQIVTNFFFGLNLPASLLVDRTAIPFTPPAIPLTHPCNSPHALKGQKLLAQGIALGIHVRTPGAL